MINCILLAFFCSTALCMESPKPKALYTAFLRKSNPEASNKYYQAIQKKQIELSKKSVIDYTGDAKKAYKNAANYLKPLIKQMLNRSMTVNKKSEEEIALALDTVDTYEANQLVDLTEFYNGKIDFDPEIRLNAPVGLIVQCEYLIKAANNYKKLSDQVNTDRFLAKAQHVENKLEKLFIKLKFKDLIESIAHDTKQEIDSFEELDIQSSVNNAEQPISTDDKTTFSNIIVQIKSLRVADNFQLQSLYKGLEQIKAIPHLYKITENLDNTLSLVNLLSQKLTRLAYIQFNLAAIYDSASSITKISTDALGFAIHYYIKQYDTYLDLAQLMGYNQHLRNVYFRKIEEFRGRTLQLINAFGLRKHEAAIPHTNNYKKLCGRYMALYPEIKDDIFVTVETQR